MIRRAAAITAMSVRFRLPLGVEDGEGVVIVSFSLTTLESYRSIPLRQVPVSR